MTALLRFGWRKEIRSASEGSNPSSIVRQPSSENVRVSRHKSSVMWSLIQRSSFSLFLSSTNQHLPKTRNSFFRISNSLSPPTPRSASRSLSQRVSPANDSSTSSGSTSHSPAAVVNTSLTRESTPAVTDTAGNPKSGHVTKSCIVVLSKFLKDKKVLLDSHKEISMLVHYELF